MRHRATKAAPSADSATAFSKYFSPKEKEKYDDEQMAEENSEIASNEKRFYRIKPRNKIVISLALIHI